MIEEVTRFQTEDGALHESEAKAENHIIRELQNLVGPIIDETGMGIRDRLAVVDVLVGSSDKAQQLKAILNRFV